MLKMFFTAVLPLSSTNVHDIGPDDYKTELRGFFGGGRLEERLICVNSGISPAEAQ